MVGQEMSHSNYETQYAAVTGFKTNSTPDISAGDQSKSSSTGYMNDNSIASAFGRLFYSFDDRYLLTATIRRDGSSKFSDDKRWGWFPSAALAWKVSNEEFLRDNEVLTGAKLRLGWGQTGNQNVSDWAYMSLLAFKTTPWGVGVLTGNTANKDLEWETTDSYNVGVDLSFLSNRIELIADGYYKKTRNLLLQLPLPSYLGSAGYGAASNPWGNVGSLENKGLELTLNTVNIDKGGVYFGGTWEEDDVTKYDAEPTETTTEGLNLNWSNAAGNCHFYWGYYMGMDYAVRAFQLARQYADANGLTATKLFVNDYNLETNPSKLAKLVEFVNYIDNANGASIVDGIGTQMHVQSTISREEIDAMFKVLAQTGKIVRVTELDVAVGSATPGSSQLEQQAKTYQNVFESYIENVPEAQRSGITIWTLSDAADEHEYWLNGDAPNLFDADYARKWAYKGVADAIAGQDLGAAMSGDLWDDKNYEDLNDMEAEEAEDAE